MSALLEFATAKYLVHDCICFANSSFLQYRITIASSSVLRHLWLHPLGS